MLDWYGKCIVTSFKFDTVLLFFQTLALKRTMMG
jgi:hypothetical protein